MIYFQYSCYKAPLYSNGRVTGWWTDIDESPQTFWAGEVGAEHTCDCGLRGTCVRTDDVCNCDSNNPTWLEDSGYITKKSSLPILGISFRRTVNSQATYSIGNLECFGRVKTHAESNQVIFNVYRTSSFTAEESIVTYEGMNVDVNSNFDVNSGIFTAPVDGVYMFAFSCRSFRSVHTWVSLRHNDKIVGSAYDHFYSANDTKIPNNRSSSVSLLKLLTLIKGDRVYVRNDGSSYMYDNNNVYTNFLGFKLHE